MAAHVGAGFGVPHLLWTAFRGGLDIGANYACLHTPASRGGEEGRKGVVSMSGKQRKTPTILGGGVRGRSGAFMVRPVGWRGFT